MISADTRKGTLEDEIVTNCLKQLRLQAGLTQEQVAEKIDTTIATVQRIENGKRRMSDKWIKRLEAAFGWTAQEIFGEAPHEPPPPVNPFLLATCFGATMKEYGEGRNLMAQAQMAAWLYEKLRADKDNAKLDAYVKEWREHEAIRNAQDVRWHRGEDAPVR